MDPDLVADVTKLKTEVEDLTMNQDVSTVLDNMHQQFELTNTLESDIDENLHTTVERVQRLEEMYNEIPMIPSQQ